MTKLPNLMKKHLLVLPFLLLILYNTIGFVAVFNAIRSEWRQSVRVELSEVAKENLVRFVFAKNELDTDEKEFEREGRFYDIVKTKIVGDSIEVYCFDDETETQLTNVFRQLIFNKKTQNDDYQHKTQLCFQSLIKDFYFPLEKIENQAPSVSNHFRGVFYFKNCFFPPNFILTDTPPPDVS